MCSEPLQPDYRTFYIIEFLEPKPQIYTMSAVNVISSLINITLFYVTIVKSKNESTLYRQASFLHNFSLYLAQFYWGSILNPVPLLPLPGVYSIGLLRPLVSTFILLLTWILLFALSIIMMYVILLIRLRVLARKTHIFHFRDSTYILFFLILLTFIYIPILSRVLPHYSTEEEMQSHTLIYYPNCMKLASSRGFFIFVNTCKSTKGVFVVLISLFGGASLYLAVCGVIIHEIREQSTTWSVNKTRNHIKVLKNTIVQNVFRFLFLAIAPAVVLRNTFLPPETDTINLTLFANAMFVAAPIPCAIVIFMQNDAYRNFLVSKVLLLKRNRPSRNESSSNRSDVAVTTTSRKTTLL